MCSQLTVANQLTDLRAHLASGRMIRQQVSADLSPCLDKSSRPHGNGTGTAQVGDRLVNHKVYVYVNETRFI
jgi:hypothetical protein